MRIVSRRHIASAQFNDARSDAPDMNASVWLETRPLKPTPHQADFRLDRTFPCVASSLNLQYANGRGRRKFSCLHNPPFAIGCTAVRAPPVGDST